MKQNFSSLKQAGKSLLGFGHPFTAALVFLAIFLGSLNANAQTVANGRFLSYDFSPITAGATITTYPSYYANTTYIDSAGTVISRGAGVTANNATAGAYGMSGVNLGTEAAAITGGDYVEFQVKPKSGYEVRLDSLILRWQFSVASQSTVLAVRTSTDGYTNTLGTLTVTSNATASGNNTSKITLTKPLYERDTFTVRIYIATPTGGGTGTRIFRFTDGVTNNSFNHDISLWGRVSTAKSLMQAFDFSTSLGSETTRPIYTCNTTYIDTVGSFDTISRGAGLAAPTATAGSYGAGGINQTSQANAITNADYFEFKLKPKTGYEFSLARIMFRYSQTTVNTGYALRSSQNNYASNIGAGTLVQAINTNGTETIELLTAGTSTVAPLVSDSMITFRLYVWGTATARSLYFTDGTSNSTINYDIAFYGDMTTSNIPAAVLSAPGATSTCLGGGINLKIATLGGSAPFTIWLKDNLGAQRTHTQSAADSTITIYPQTNRSYTLDSVKDANGDKAWNVTGSVSVTVTSSPVIASAGTTIARTLSHLDGYTLTYASGDSCKSWVKITDSVGGTNPGSTTCTAEVLASSPSNTTARTYVARRLNVAPTTNGVARVTLFYSQAEFTAFNALVTYQQKLPINSTDTVDVKTKIRIRRTSSSLETGSTTTFTPDSVTWNTNTSTWEINFRVNDGVLGGNYYLSPQFTSTKLITGLAHQATTPSSGQTNATVRVYWDSLAGVAQYRMRFRPAGSSTWNVSTITGKQRILTTLAFNTSYEVQIRAYESATVQGEYTTTYTFTTPVEPNKLPTCQAPTNIVATVTSPLTATVSWTGVLFGTTYLVEMRAKNTLVWGGTSTTGTSVNFVSLAPNTTYEFRIRTTCETGYTDNGVSAYSTVDTFKTQTLNACGTVSNLSTVSTTATSGIVKWSPVTFATSYFVQIRLKNTATWGGMSTADTTLTLNNLASSSIYEYQVRANCYGVPAVTTNANGSFSSIAEFTTASAPVIPACLPPANIVATPTSNSVTITWDSIAYGPSYFINIKPASSTTWGGTTVAGSSRTFTALLPATDYHVRIRTNCAPGAALTTMSNFSDTVFFTTTALANKVIEGTNEANVWHVYPNPTRDNLHVNFNSISEEAIRVEVRDMTGRMVQTINHNPAMGENTLDINLQSAADGLYLIHIYQGQTLQFMNRVQKTH